MTVTGPHFSLMDDEEDLDKMWGKEEAGFGAFCISIWVLGGSLFWNGQALEQGMGGHTKISRNAYQTSKGADHHKLDLKSQVQGRGCDRYCLH